MAMIVVHQVLYPDLVSTPESFPICSTVAMRNAGMPVFIAVVHIGWAMIFSVLAGALNAVMETATFNLLPLGWRILPGLLPVSLGRGWHGCNGACRCCWIRCRMGSRNTDDRRRSESRNRKTRKSFLHSCVTPRLKLPFSPRGMKAALNGVVYGVPPDHFLPPGKVPALIIVMNCTQEICRNQREIASRR